MNATALAPARPADDLKQKAADFNELLEATALEPFDPEVAVEICRRLETGRRLDDVCKDSGLPGFATVLKWAADVPAFRTALDHFEECGLEIMGQNLVTMADQTFGADKTLIDANKLRIQTRQWVLERRHRSRYGDSIDVNHKGAIGVKASFHFDLGGGAPGGRVIDVSATAAYASELIEHADKEAAAKPAPRTQPPLAADEEDIFS